ncbi:FHA domain-containing protein [Paenibacillus lutrae]|nr:FHA domain-containing protein [Paenibacillus lutrae]
MKLEQFGLQAEYRSGQGRWLTLGKEEGLLRHELAPLQFKMLTEETIPHVLSMESEEIDFNVKLVYNLHAKLSLSEVIRNRKLSADKCLYYLHTAAACVSNSRNYMLSEAQFVLDSRFIFTSNLGADLHMLCVPLQEIPAASLESAWANLIQDMVTHLAVTERSRLQPLINKCMEPGFTAESLKKAIYTAMRNSKGEEYNSVKIESGIDYDEFWEEKLEGTAPPGTAQHRDRIHDFETHGRSDSGDFLEEAGVRLPKFAPSRVDDSAEMQEMPEESGGPDAVHFQSRRQDKNESVDLDRRYSEAAGIAGMDLYNADTENSGLERRHIPARERDQAATANGSARSSERLGAEPAWEQRGAAAAFSRQQSRGRPGAHGAAAARPAAAAPHAPAPHAGAAHPAPSQASPGESAAASAAAAAPAGPILGARARTGALGAASLIIAMIWNAYLSAPAQPLLYICSGATLLVLAAAFALLAIGMPGMANRSAEEVTAASTSRGLAPATEPVSLERHYAALGERTTLLMPPAPPHSAADETVFLGQPAAASSNQQERWPVLEAMRGGRKETILLDTASFMIGRGETDVHYVEDVPGVSRVHAEIIRMTEGYAVKDLNSRNGTFLNGERISPYQSVYLSDGDVIRIVHTEFIFRT